MEFMKRVYLVILVTLVHLGAHAQYNETVLKAFEKSYVFEKEGDFKQSANVLKAVYLEDSYELNLRLGWLMYNIGLFEDSKNYYKKALVLLPYSEEARFGLVLPCSALGEWDEVAGLYKEILTNSPGNTKALYNLGLIHYNRKEWAQAARLFQKVVDLYPFDYGGLLMMAWTNLQLGKSREAKVLFNRVLLWSPGDASALEGLDLLK